MHERREKAFWKCHHHYMTSKMMLFIYVPWPLLKFQGVSSEVIELSLTLPGFNRSSSHVFSSTTLQFYWVWMCGREQKLPL